MNAATQIVKRCKEALENREFYFEEGEFYPDEEVMGRYFIGTVFALDPCGRYHHFISPNGITEECIEFWEDLEEQLDVEGMSLVAGEDPCDVFAEVSRRGEELERE